MEREKSRIVKVFATAEFEIFNSESVEDAERRAFEDADMELRSIYAGSAEHYYDLYGFVRL